MAESVVVEGVVLRGDDLNVQRYPWKGIKTANTLRLVPILLGLLVFSVYSGAMFDPSLAQIFLMLAPLLLGWLAFSWVTNTLFLGAIKKTYAATPMGAGPCTFTFDAEGMRQSTPHSSSAFRWSAIVHVTDDRRGFAFWMTPYVGVSLPSRFLSDTQTAALRALIADARSRGEIKGAA